MAVREENEALKVGVGSDSSFDRLLAERDAAHAEVKRLGSLLQIETEALEQACRAWPDGIDKETAKFRAENGRLKGIVDNVAYIATAYGWNGVDNSKILTTFLDGSLLELTQLRRERDTLRAENEALKAARVDAAAETKVRQVAWNTCDDERVALRAQCEALKTQYKASHAALTEVMSEHTKLRDEEQQWRDAHALQHEQLEALGAQVTSLKAEMARLVLAAGGANG